MTYLDGLDMALIGVVKPLMESSIQPAGIDLTLSEVERLSGAGLLNRFSKKLPPAQKIDPENNVYQLPPGVYRIRFSEIVRIPIGYVGFCYPRSSLLRMGVHLGCAVWDPGYVGRGQALLAVLNPHGWSVERYARVAQLVLARIEGPARSSYRGSYQLEGV
ncbi:MAG: deoxyuridine 5'-triphosphate nucleotidohydrolase [Aeropyrum sp.]|nr:deoxyuridine 5'-triphosphate nucleotidohydrolase [Aeropyrum sp.]